MLQTHKPTIKLAIAFILLIVALPLRSAEQFTPEHMSLYRDFLRLLNYGEEDEFYKQAEKYTKFLRDSDYMEEYFKIKTNVGFFDVNHQYPLRAMKTATELDRELRSAGKEDLYYLATGLKGDIYKATHNMAKADSVYKQALEEVGQRDPKFTMLVHMSLTEVNLAREPEDALHWANSALEEAERLDNMEYRSMTLASKGYLYFMLGQREDFIQTLKQYEALKADFQKREAEGEVMGRQRFNYRFDKVLNVAQTAFDGDFEKAEQMAEEEQLSVDRQMVLFRINAMEGEAKKEQATRRLTWGFIAMTALYLFVYIMGRRRLMLKIWKREKELRVAMEKADAGNRMKTAFIRSMSHEIRTPLNAINGFSQILCSPDFELDEEEKADLKQRITSSSEAITIIINELLELAAGESVTLDKDNLLPVHVNEECRVATAMAEEHNNKGLQMQFTTELPDAFTIQSNSETLSQILGKVIDNALKFTEEGSVNVHARQAGNRVEISVTDTGIGIPEDKQADVFENFVKLDDYKEGIGLGLPICRRLAKTLGGNIVLDPKYKNGSRFIVQLPL